VGVYINRWWQIAKSLSLMSLGFLKNGVWCESRMCK